MPPLNTYPPLQRQVFSLYRRALRTILTKPFQERATWRLYWRWSFRTKAASVTRRDISAVEYLLRQGRRQVQMLAMGSVTRAGLGEEGRAWAGERGERGDYWSGKEGRVADVGKS
ncbi:hypothetical protein CALVIDRAFT_559974 [Calocera viscosa TUFC12733]|uniref:Complex 1 LYR protein domain-containing protein n=1 Tax=Calocera viscosa (strain TUFC12733) TaxID=1330018 RepID=A0A167RWU2_CALVF|nr:hypothetical protein CALVIDRAFT_559974 [Calocera viscosa TUFC12733]